MNGLQRNFMKGSEVVKRTSSKILVVIQITMLPAQLEIRPLLKHYKWIVMEFYGGSGVVTGTSTCNYILVAIRITMLIAQLGIWSLLSKL